MALAFLATAQLLPLQAAAIIQLRVIEGEGAVYAAGSRATRGITVQVTDETGQPVEAAAVSFRLPDDGPGGTFGTGLRTEIVTTKADGRATVWGMQWNRTTGPFEVRITAAKDQTRAGIVVSQYLSDKVAAGSGGKGEFHSSHSYRKWLLIGAAVGGAALGGLALGGRKTQTPAPANTPQPPVIGPPVIVIGMK
ncbi:MAG: hypothetical protein ABSH47_06750 [Bryobacteraceae bacterium]